MTDDDTVNKTNTLYIIPCAWFPFSQAYAVKVNQKWYNGHMGQHFKNSNNSRNTVNHGKSGMVIVTPENCLNPMDL